MFAALDSEAATWRSIDNSQFRRSDPSRGCHSVVRGGHRTNSAKLLWRFFSAGRLQLAPSTRISVSRNGDPRHARSVLPAVEFFPLPILPPPFVLTRQNLLPPLGCPLFLDPRTVSGRSLF